MGAIRSRFLGGGRSNTNGEFRVLYLSNPNQIPGVLKLTGANLHFTTNAGVVHIWPLNTLRRYGCADGIFSFESGRRCDSGEGYHFFQCKQANVLHSQLVEQFSQLHDNRRNEELDQPRPQLPTSQLQYLPAVGAGNSGRPFGSGVAVEQGGPLIGDLNLSPNTRRQRIDAWAANQADSVAAATASYQQENGYVFPVDHAYINDPVTSSVADPPPPRPMENTYYNLSGVSPPDAPPPLSQSATETAAATAAVPESATSSPRRRPIGSANSDTPSTSAFVLPAPPTEDPTASRRINYIQLDFVEESNQVLSNDVFPDVPSETPNSSSALCENNNEVAATGAYTQIDFPRTDAMQRLQEERRRGRLQSTQGSSLGSLVQPMSS